jgi:uncharacterized protein (UPF0335 family)
MTTRANPVDQQLRDFIARIERLREEKTALREDESAVFAEAKATGFDTKALRRVLKRREVDKAERDAFDSTVDTYEFALGMAEPPPLFAHVGLMAVDFMARDKVVAAFGELVPPLGEIIVRVGTVSVSIARDDLGKLEVADYVEPAPPPPTRPESARTKRKTGHLSAAKGGAEPTLEDARRMGGEAGRDRSTGKNPFDKGDIRRAAWDGAYTKALDGAPGEAGDGTDEPAEHPDGD